MAEGCLRVAGERLRVAGECLEVEGCQGVLGVLGLAEQCRCRMRVARLLSRVWVRAVRQNY